MSDTNVEQVLLKKDGTPRKKAGKPAGGVTATASQKLLRVLVTPRQEFLLAELRKIEGMSESEHVRRAIDDYLKEMIRTKRITDSFQPSQISSLQQQVDDLTKQIDELTRS